MAVCETCGESDFQLVDGLYYCVQCHTQTQDMKEEELENEDNYPNYSLEIKAKKGRSKKAEKEKRDPGRPWHTHEAWTIILRRQVEALVKLGANPKLKDVVLRMWVRHLAKCRVAFTLSQLPPHPESVCRDRDQSCPSVENPVVSDTKVKRSHRQRLAGMTTVRRAKENKERQLLQEALKDEEFYEGDSPFGAGPAPSGDVSPEDDKSDGSEGEEDLAEDDTETAAIRQHVMKSHERVSHYRSNECMTPYKTLALCYLGLMYLHPLVVPSDLIRWIKMEKFPFRYQMLRSLPGDMTFCMADFKTFWANTVPTGKAMRRQAGLLCGFLGLQTCFKSVPLQLMCSRYILEMNLPVEFHQLTRGLLGRIPYPLRAVRGGQHVSQEGGSCQLMEGEYLAAACIVLLLKMLCGVDTDRQKKISSCARKIQSMYKPEQGLFVFEDWLHYMEHTQHSAHLDPFSATIEDMCGIRDTGALFRAFSQKQEEQRSFSNRVTSSKVKTKAQTKATQESLQKPFLALLEKYQLQQEQSTWKQQFGDLRPEEDDDCEDEEFLPMENSLIAMLEESPVSPKQEEMGGACHQRLTGHATGDLLRQSTVAYILDKKYLQKLDHRLQSSDFEYMTHETDHETSSMPEEPLISPSQSLFSQSEDIMSELGSEYSDIQLNQTKRTIGKHVEEAEEPELDEVLKVQDQLEKLTNKTSYNVTSQEQYWSRSYDRTLRVCSQLIGCQKTLLNWHVWLMELFCLLGNDPNFKKHREYYLKKYFHIKQ